MPHDQAVKLRLLVDGHHEVADETSRAGRSIVVYGAKGGVGTTTVALNLAVALSIAGKTVELAAREHLDAPLSAGPGGIMLRAASSWRAVLRPSASPHDWPASTGGEPASREWRIVDGGKCDEGVDSSEKQQTLLVTTVEPASILAAYDVLREARAAGWWPAVVWNRVSDEPSAHRATERLQATVRRMWGQTFQEYRLTESPEALIASRTGVPVVLSHPLSAWTHQMRRLAEEWLDTLATRAA